MRVMVAFVLSFLVSLPSTALAADRDDIVTVVTDAYVNGVHVKFDAAAMRRGFHPEFRMLVLTDGKMSAVPLEEWIGRMEKNAAGGPVPRPKVTHQIPQVTVTGSAAVAQIEIWRDGRHTFTDFLSLYRFADGWKIVSKTFYSHPRE